MVWIASTLARVLLEVLKPFAVAMSSAGLAAIFHQIGLWNHLRWPLVGDWVVLFAAKSMAHPTAGSGQQADPKRCVVSIVRIAKAAGISL